MTFKDWCLQNGKTWMLDLWDYDATGCTPEDVPHGSRKKVYLWCGNPNHHPVGMQAGNLTRKNCKVTKDNFCIGCRSVGQFILDSFGEAYLKEVWSDKNDKDSFDIPAGSSQKFWLRCLENPKHPDYQIKAQNYKKGHRCPYCTHQKVIPEESVGGLYPQAVELWSDQNTISPFEISWGTKKKVWWKCQNPDHPEYFRSVYQTVRSGFRCPICSIEYKKQSIPSGPDSPLWNPEIHELAHFRTSPAYRKWRKRIFEIE